MIDHETSVRIRETAKGIMDKNDDFKITLQHQDSKTDTTMETTSTSITDVLKVMERFLKASGFEFKGHLQIEDE